MKALLSAVTWVVAFSATSSTIYDNLQTQPTVSETVYNYNVTTSHPANLWHVFDPDLDGQIPASEWLNAQSKIEELCKADLGDHTGHGVTVTTYTGNHRTDPRYFDFQCQGSWTSSDGQDSGSLSSAHLLFAYSTTVAQVCDEYSTLVNGNCYLVADILSNDTCPTGGNDILPMNGTLASNGFVCAAKPDGSSCKYVPSETGDFLISDPEGTFCYTDPNAEQWQDTNLTQPSGNNGECGDIGGGVTACKEDPLNVCPNGQCYSGCGNMTFNGVTQFLCLSDDSDNDGIPDYHDIDCDGDGVPNSQELTNCKGQEVPSTVIPQPTIHGPGFNPPGTGTGTGGTGGEPVNITVNVDEDKIITGIVNGLTNNLVKTQDFSGQTEITAMEAKKAETDTQIDTLLQDENFNLAKQVEDSNLLSGFESATSKLNSTGCSATFAVPLTNESIDLCEGINKARPFLWVLFAFGTFVYCWTRISSTVRNQN